MARSGSSLRPAYSYTQRSRLYGIPRLIRSRKEGRDLLKLGEGEPLASHLPQGGVRALSTPNARAKARGAQGGGRRGLRRRQAKMVKRSVITGEAEQGWGGGGVGAQIGCGEGVCGRRS